MKRRVLEWLAIASIPFVRLWLATLRVRVVMAPALEPYLEDPRPWVLCFFHGTQFVLLRWPRRRATGVLVSHSRDGALQARFLGALGFRIVRGSTSKGGAEGLRALVRFARKSAGSTGGDLAFAVDGPRGPYGEVHGGAIVASELARGLLVPMGAASAQKVTLAKAWDRFEIPLPFSRVCVYLGPPSASASDALKCSIVQANLEATRSLDSSLEGASGLQRSVLLPPTEVE